MIDREEIEEEIRDGLSAEGYFLGDFTYVGKDGLTKLIDKCTGYALENPTADVIAYAQTLVSEPLYKIIWSCPDPKVSISNWFSKWLPDNCVSAYFYAGNGEFYTLEDLDYPTWSDLPYAPYNTYDVPSNIQSQIKNQAIGDYSEVITDGNDDPDDIDNSIEDEDLCERCLVMCYQTLR